MKNRNIRPVFYLDKDYPARLKNCDDSPIMLFFKGDVDMNPRRMLSVVGTRHITTYGKEATERIIRDLKEYDPVIVSGLAYGVDIQAHKCALRYGLPTIGVVAHGLDKMYPSANAATAEKMLLNGGLLTEYISGTKPDRDNFPARNRIVAGLCDAVVVIESADRGGALITADIANSYNREVFALPGRTGDLYSHGCNMLIKQNKAVLFESAADIADVLNWNQKTKPEKRTQMFLFEDHSPEEKTILVSLQNSDSMTLDDIALNVQIPVNRVSSILLKLEFDGLLSSFPGKVFKLNH
jgi:DNA processing protein